MNLSNVSKCGLDPHDIGRIHEKTYVMIDIPIASAVQYAYPRLIVHDTGKRIWVGARYSDVWPEEATPVGDGCGDCYDAAGNCIVSIPVSWCSFYTEKEANDIIQCIDADTTLLGYM